MHLPPSPRRTSTQTAVSKTCASCKLLCMEELSDALAGIQTETTTPLACETELRLVLGMVSGAGRPRTSRRAGPSIQQTRVCVQGMRFMCSCLVMELSERPLGRHLDTNNDGLVSEMELRLVLGELGAGGSAPAAAQELVGLAAGGGGDPRGVSFADWSQFVRRVGGKTCLTALTSLSLPTEWSQLVHWVGSAECQVPFHHQQSPKSALPRFNQLGCRREASLVDMSRG